MKFKTRLVSLLALLLFAMDSNVFAQELRKTAEVEGITEYQMENGLKVLLFPDNSAQTITVNITYLVGSRHEGYGEKGMAHLLEHMVFKGTPNHPDIPEELSSHGSRPNGTTWYDRTNYFETFNATAENLEWALDLEADRMVNSYIAKEDLESEFSVVRNEFESGENSPVTVLMQKVIDAGFLWHNYGNSTIGNKSDIERVPIENLQAFYKKFYRPDNAVLMVTGKIDEAATLNLIKDKFGPLQKPATPVRNSYTEEPAQDGEKSVTLERVGDLQLFTTMYHTPAGPDEEYAAMAILEEVLTNEPSGRLYKKLIDGQKASSLWSFSPFTKEPGFLYINVNVPSDKSVDDVEQIVKETFDNFEPVTQEELDRAKAYLSNQIDQQFRNSAFLGTYMSEFIGAGDWRLSFITRDRIEAMTLDKVNEVAKKYFIATNRTVGKFLPTSDPQRVQIPHPTGIEELVTSYVGRESKGTGEAFDVSYENITNRLESGLMLERIEFGLVEKENRGETVQINFNMRNGDVNTLTGLGMIPSFTSQMLDKGTKNRSRQEIEDELSRLKSSVDIGARNGNIYVTINTTKPDLMGTLEIMADMIKNPLFEASELEKLKTERLASLEQNKTEPNFLAFNKLNRINNSYPKGHPLYPMTLEEQEEAIKSVTIQDVQDFYSKFYGLGRTTLMAIGTFDGEEVKSFIAKEFEGFDSQVAYEAVNDPYQANKAANERILTPDKKNAFTFGQLNVELSDSDDDYAALNMAGEILGGGFLNSRIADRLRQKDGVSYGAGGSFNGDGNAEARNSSFFVYSIYNPDNLDKVQLGFTEEIDRFIAEGITEEELKNAVNGWVQGQTVSRAKDQELAVVINNNLYYKRDLSYQKQLEERTMSLTVSDVNAAIKKYIKPFSEWTVVNAGDFERE